MTLRLPAHAPPRDPAALARDILSQSRFRVRVQAPAQHTWWDAARSWIGDRWNQLLNAFSQHVHVSPRWSVTAGDVLIAVIVAFVILYAVRLLLTMAHDGANGPVGAQALAVHADARELQAAAEQAAEHGAYAPAVALLFQAALALLDARGVLRDDPARTVNECRSDVRARAAHVSAPFDRLARVFTAAIYAEDRMMPEQWAQARDAYGAFASIQRDAA